MNNYKVEIENGEWDLMVIAAVSLNSAIREFAYACGYGAVMCLSEGCEGVLV
jgi:hypothetical protein